MFLGMVGQRVGGEGCGSFVPGLVRGKGLKRPVGRTARDRLGVETRSQRSRHSTPSLSRIECPTTLLVYASTIP